MEPIKKQSSSQNSNDPRKGSSLEETQKKLYSNHFEPKENRAKLSKKDYNIKDQWDNQGSQLESKNDENDYWGPNSLAEEDNPGSKFGTFGIVLIVAILFFISSIGYAFYVFNQGFRANSGNEVSVNVMGPVSIGGGEELVLDIIVQNNNLIAMELVDLIIDYPLGTKDSSDLITDLRRERISLGDIPANSVIRRNISAALFGEENSLQEIVVSIQYRLEGSNAIYERKRSFEIVLSASPVRLVIDGLREVSSGQELELRARLSSNSTKPLKDVMVVARYPFGFTFESANIDPTIDDNIWIFNTLGPEEEVEIIMRGEIRGQEGEDRVFRFNTGIRSEDQRDQLGIVWGNITHETSIQQSFANLAIAIGGSYDNSISVTSGEIIDATLYFYNNTDDVIRNIKLELQLDGDALDKRSVTVRDGFYNSSNNTIFWNPETHGKFQSLKAGESLELSIRFSSVNMESSTDRILKPEINLRATAEAVRISGDRIEENIRGNTSTKLAVLSDLSANIYTAFGSGPLNNSGPIPPVAEQDTTYTLVFEVTNGNNDMENIRFVTTIPSYVKWERVVNPPGVSVTYNENTREVVWNIGNLQSGIGTVTPPMLMYASVTLHPSLSQVGKTVDLTRNSKLIGFDSFVKENISQASSNATTKIYNRPNFDGHSNVAQ